MDRAMPQVMAIARASAPLVETHRFITHPTSPWYSTAKWLPRLRARLIREWPGLLLAQAWVLCGERKFAGIPPLVDAIDAAAERREWDQVMAGELSFFRGHAWFYRVDDAYSLVLLEEALTYIPEDPTRVRRSVQIQYALALQKAGRLDRALSYVGGLATTGDARVSPFIARLQTGLGLVHLLEADLCSVERENRMVHDRIKLIEILALKALALHKRGRVEGATRVLKKAGSLARPGGVPRPFVESGQPMADLLSRLDPATGDASFVRGILAVLGDAAYRAAPRLLRRTLSTLGS